MQRAGRRPTLMPFVQEIVPEVDLDGRPGRARPARGLLASRRRRTRGGAAAAGVEAAGWTAGRRGRRRPSRTDVRIDVVTIFPEYLATAGRLAGRQGARRGAARRARARPARLDHRPAQHGRRHPVRRRPGHGHEPGPVGRRALDDGLWPAATRHAGGTGAGRPHAAGGRSPSARPWSSAGEAPGAGFRPVRGHRPPGDRGLRARATGSTRSPSATTCWPAARPRCWSSSRRWPGCCPGCSATPSRSSTSRTARPTCWRAPSTPSRPRGRAEVPDVLLTGHHGKIAALAPGRGAAPHGRSPARPDRALDPSRRSTSTTARCSPSWAGSRSTERLGEPV